jgi:hypothetical protein
MYTTSVIDPNLNNIIKAPKSTNPTLYIPYVFGAAIILFFMLKK